MEVLAKKETRIIQTPGLSTSKKRKRLNNNHQVRFSLYQTHDSALFFISSSLLDAGNFKIILQGKHFLLFISEAKEIEKPIHIHNIQQKYLEGEVTEKLKTFDYKLPDDGFRLEQIAWNNDKKRVEVHLQHAYNNWDKILKN